MPVSINNTTLTFNDATTQTTSGVTAVNVSTGISSSGGKTPTLTNTGVTSVTAGTGISVSASTGGITITNSAPAGGGVTSLNGQTGAITNTTLDTIGSYVTALVGLTISVGSPNNQGYTVGNTIAGSSLRVNYNFVNNTTLNDRGWGGLGGQMFGYGSGNNTSIPYPAGGSTLSGTWRCMGQDRRQYNNGTDCNSIGTWVPGLFVRVS